jgi:hypothetical protein
MTSCPHSSLFVRLATTLSSKLPSCPVIAPVRCCLGEITPKIAASRLHIQYRGSTSFTIHPRLRVTTYASPALLSQPANSTGYLKNRNALPKNTEASIPSFASLSIPSISPATSRRCRIVWQYYRHGLTHLRTLLGDAILAHRCSAMLRLDPQSRSAISCRCCSSI